MKDFLPGCHNHYFLPLLGRLPKLKRDLEEFWQAVTCAFETSHQIVGDVYDEFSHEILVHWSSRDIPILCGLSDRDRPSTSSHPAAIAPSETLYPRSDRASEKPTPSHLLTVMQWAF